MTTARDRAKHRRQKSDEAEQAYQTFLENLAGPLARQIVNALRSEGYSFTVSTPGRGLRVSLDQGRDDFIELALSTDADQPHVVGQIRRTRGSRTLDEERPVKAGRRTAGFERRRSAGILRGRARAVAGEVEQLPTPKSRLPELPDNSSGNVASGIGIGSSAVTTELAAAEPGSSRSGGPC